MAQRTGPSERLSRTRSFTLQDQIDFARLSGDNNPAHLDSVAARRFIFGRLVVHGIHSLLWAMDKWLDQGSEKVRLVSIKASFHRPITLEEPVICAITAGGDFRTRIQVMGSGSVAVRIKIDWDTAVDQASDNLTPGFPTQRSPRLMAESNVMDSSGELELNLHTEAAAQLFPHLLDRLPKSQIAVILATSRLVGVECPGLRSLFSELSLYATVGNKSDGLRYIVKKFDRRFNMVSMHVATPSLCGSVNAILRPPPQEQAACLSLSSLVEPQEFSGQRALVIGGSRGLGEVAAKLLCVGGADVRITYFKGLDDAHRVVEDILRGHGRAGFFRFDVLDPAADPLPACLGGWTPTHLYYFATPYISSGKRGAFSTVLFNEFCSYYVGGFIRTVNRLLDVPLQGIFYPSTVYIDELPHNMAEYVSAKMAGETICRFLEKAEPQIRMLYPRLPAMATDQTASLVSVANPDPAPIMANILRSGRAR